MTGRGAPAQELTRSVTWAQCNILSTQLPVCMVSPVQQSYPFINYNCASHTCPFRWLSSCTQTYPSVNLSEIKNQQLRTGLPVGSDVVVRTTSKLQYLFESFGVYTSMRQPLTHQPATGTSLWVPFWVLWPLFLTVADSQCCHSPASTESAAQCVPRLPARWRPLTAGSVNRCLWQRPERCRRCACCRTPLTSHSEHRFPAPSSKLCQI